MSPLIEVAGVHKQLGARQVLAGVDLTCAAAETVVVVGANGAGKSTLLRVASGLLEPDRGEISICGHPLRTRAVHAKSRLGYVPDGLEALPNLLVSEFLALVRTLKGSRDPGDGEAARFHVTELLRRPLPALSLGQRKRVALVAALIGAPPVLLLDEPTNGLDAEGVERIEALIGERSAAGATTLLSTNDAGFELRLSATSYRLEHGRLSPLR